MEILGDSFSHLARLETNRKLTMKLTAFFFVAIGFTASAACVRPADQFGFETLVLFDVDVDAVTDLKLDRYYTDHSGGGRNLATVGYTLAPTESLTFLRANSVGLGFPTEAPISSANHVYQNAAQQNAIALNGYWIEEIIPGTAIYECSDRSGVESFGNQREALLGYRLNLDDGPHYGWIRFTRPDTEPSTPFTVAGYNYHPLPNEPIGAGQPPTPPPVNTTYDEAAGTLSLNWDARFPGVALEYTESLTEPVEWQPVPDASVPPVLLPVPETDRFYRLRTQ